MIGSRGNKGRMEEKIQVIHDMILEILKDLKSNDIDRKSIRRKLEYIRKVSYELVAVGDGIRQLIGNKIDNLDRELVKLI